MGVLTVTAAGRMFYHHPCRFDEEIVGDPPQPSNEYTLIHVWNGVDRDFDEIVIFKGGVGVAIRDWNSRAEIIERDHMQDCQRRDVEASRLEIIRRPVAAGFQGWCRSVFSTMNTWFLVSMSNLYHCIGRPRSSEMRDVNMLSAVPLSPDVCPSQRQGRDSRSGVSGIRYRQTRVWWCQNRVAEKNGGRLLEVCRPRGHQELRRRADSQKRPRRGDRPAIAIFVR